MGAASWPVYPTFAHISIRAQTTAKVCVYTYVKLFIRLALIGYIVVD